MDIVVCYNACSVVEVRHEPPHQFIGLQLGWSAKG